MANPENPVFISRPKIAIRHVAEKQASKRLTTTLVNEYKLEESDMHLRAGRGLFIFLNHITKRDTVDMFRIPFTDPEMARRKIDYPVNEEHKSLLKINTPSYLTGCHPSYIITPEGEKDMKEQGKPIVDKEGKLLRYVENTFNTLGHGGISLIFPQRTRSAHLYEPGRTNPQTLRALYLQSIKYNVDFAVLFVGTSITNMNQQDYEARYEEIKDELNPDLECELNIGPTYSRRKLLDLANGNPRNLDNISYGILETLIRPMHIGQKPNQG